MDPQIKAALELLGFVESVNAGKLPMMKCVNKKYHKLAKLHHPDRKGGNSEVFKKITEAYRLIGEYQEGLVREDHNEETFDYEEEVARRTFKQFQFSKIQENMRCIPSM